MKLLLLTYEYPPFRGGVATYLANLMKTVPAGVEVTIDIPKAGEHWLETIWRLCMKPHGGKPDLVAISHVLPAGYIAYNMNFWHKTPYLVFTHGSDILNARHSAWKRSWMRFILRHAKFVVANSRFTAALLQEEGITHIEIIPPSIGSTLLTTHYSLLPKIISIGRLIPRKGFDTLIKTMPLILKAIPAAHLQIIGNGPYYEELIRLAHELHVEKFVDVLTDVTDEKKTEYLAASALFALAARKDGNDIEGFGIVTLEASAAGLPVVVTNSGGAAEPVVSGVTGVVAPCDDIETLAATIISLLNDPEGAKKMGAAGREYVAKEYSLAAIGQRFWSIVVPSFVTPAKVGDQHTINNR